MNTKAWTIVMNVIGVVALLTAQVSIAAIRPTNISVGFDSSCVLTNGALKCFGSNMGGLFGIGNSSPSSNPAPVSAFTSVSGIKGVCTTLYHTCVYTVNGDAFCAGDGSMLGNPSAGSQSSTPVAPVGLAGITRKVVCGAKYSCALLNSGAVRCWGIDEEGALVNGASEAAVTSPQAVVGFETGGAIDLEAGGFTTCVITVAGGVQCGGSGVFGQIGNGQEDDSNVLVPVSGLTSGVVSLTMGTAHACAMTNTGAIYCWGMGNGNLMLNGAGKRVTPLLMSILGSDVRSIHAGGLNSAVIMKDGTVRVWGHNTFGELGFGFATTGLNYVQGPTVVPGCNKVVEISFGNGLGAACLRTEDGSLYCSGKTGLAVGDTNKFTRVPGIGSSTSSSCTFTFYTPYQAATTGAPSGGPFTFSHASNQSLAHCVLVLFSLSVVFFSILH